MQLLSTILADLPRLPRAEPCRERQHREEQQGCRQGELPASPTTSLTGSVTSEAIRRSE